MPAVVLKENELPVEAMTALVDAAGKEGHSFVVRLLRDWSSGTNRFAQHGEAFFVAWDKSVVVGVLGLSLDPSAHDPTVGRLRHLYVHPGQRGVGIGSELCRRAIKYARPSFRVIRMRTPDGKARALYERVGFTRVFGDPKSTYELALRG